MKYSVNKEGRKLVKELIDGGEEVDKNTKSNVNPKQQTKKQNV